MTDTNTANASLVEDAATENVGDDSMLAKSSIKASRTANEGTACESTGSASDKKNELPTPAPLLTDRWALVYLRMPNGSLEDRLACSDDTPPLSASVRLRVALGVARGLVSCVHRKCHLIHLNIQNAGIRALKRCGAQRYKTRYVVHHYYRHHHDHHCRYHLSHHFHVRQHSA